jgi:hypothetical protein
MFSRKRAEPIPLPPSPYVLATSGSFEGNDGKWSTFKINIGGDGTGSTGQNFNVLISTSSSSILIPGETDWCDNDECARSRGIGIYNGKQSLGLQNTPPWKDAGIYKILLPDWWIDTLSIDGNNETGGIWGVDSVGLGTSSSDSPILNDQYVVKYLLKNFYLGSFGLAAGNSGPNGGDKPNFLENFYGSAHLIASRSYGYTAGAYYRK